MNSFISTRWLSSVYFSLSVMASVFGLALCSGNLFVDPLRLIELPTIDIDLTLFLLSIVTLEMLLQVLQVYARFRPADALKRHLIFAETVISRPSSTRRICFEDYGSRAPPLD